MSGLFDLESIRHVDFVADDLKLDQAMVERLSPAGMPQSHPAPFITSVGDLESDEFKRQNALIAQQWQPSHQRDIPLQGFNHLTICDAFASPGHPLFEATCELLSSV